MSNPNSGCGATRAHPIRPSLFSVGRRIGARQRVESIGDIVDDSLPNIFRHDSDCLTAMSAIVRQRCLRRCPESSRSEAGSGGDMPSRRFGSKPDSKLSVIGELMSRGPRYFCSNPAGPNLLNSGELPAASACASSGRLASAGRPKISLIVSITALWSPSTCETACVRA